MPLVQVDVFEDELSQEQSKNLINKITDVITEVTSEKLREVTWVIINEVKDGHWGVGGNALRLDDVKKLIAYSSVSHLGFCVLGMFALNDIGVSGAVMYMINHGLSTGALFLCIGMIYERFHTREMARMGGLARVIPIWAFFMVLRRLAAAFFLRTTLGGS